MNPILNVQLSHMNNAFRQISGRGFDHFFCPIVYQDHNTELALGHVIPRSFNNSARATVVQRKDVDNFYGHFENRFQQIQETDRPIDDLLGHRGNVLSPKLLLDGIEIESYPFQGNFNTPSHHTLVGKIDDDIPVPWRIMKLPPNEFDAHSGRYFIEIEGDFRFEALISCLKAAHLTLFKLLGYRYAVSNAGIFLGYGILGSFFELCRDMDKGSSEFSLATERHFNPYINMVRPVINLDFPVDITGTVSDRRFLVLWDDAGVPWALLVFVRFGRWLNGVLVPSGNNNYDLYNQMLNSQTSFPAKASLAQFNREKFDVDPRQFDLSWVAPNFD